MCGIVAMIAPHVNGFQQAETKAFSDMLFVDTLRGWDSTGVFGVNADNDVHILKSAQKGPDFMVQQEYKTFISDQYMDGRILVGHNRAATRGTVSDKNAHPFWVEDNIILVQNGTWYGDHTHIKNTDVDTEAIAHLMHDHQDDLEAGLQKVNAAYALVWYNRNKQTLYAIRNDDRPLHIGYCKNGVILLASEMSTILFAAQRQNLSLKELPYQLADGYLNTWNFNNKGELEFDTSKIDNEYKGTSFRRQHSWDYAEYYNFNQAPNDDDTTHPLDRRYENVRQLTHSAVKPDDVRIAFSDYIAEGRFPDSEFSFPTAKIIKDLAEGLVEEGRVVGVEFMDFLPGNKHHKCTAWYVVGRLIVPETDILRDVLVYAPILGKNETEIMEYVTTNMFTAKVNDAIMRFVPKAQKNIITLRASEIKEFENIDATA